MSEEQKCKKCEQLNASALLQSEKFKKVSEYILYRLGINQWDDVANDIRQEMAIEVIDAIRTYDSEKINGNFWAYAYQKMNYKAVLFVGGNTVVKIPRNRRGEEHWVKLGYDKVETAYTEINNYSEFSFLENHITSIERLCENMDLKNMISKLSKKEKYIVEVKLGLRVPVGNGTTYESIAMDMDLKKVKVNTIFLNAVEKLKRMSK